MAEEQEIQALIEALKFRLNVFKQAQSTRPGQAEIGECNKCIEHIHRTFLSLIFDEFRAHWHHGNCSLQLVSGGGGGGGGCSGGGEGNLGKFPVGGGGCCPRDLLRLDLKPPITSWSRGTGFW